jgi:hypothetical protein
MRSPRVPSDTAKCIAAAKDVVNAFGGDYVRRRAEDGLMGTNDFRGRLQTVVEMLAPKVRGDASASEFSLRCGLSRATISSAIRNQSCAASTLKILHELAGVDLHWLICGEGAPGNLRLPDTAARSIAERTKRPTRPEVAVREKPSKPPTRASKKHG